MFLSTKAVEKKNLKMVDVRVGGIAIQGYCSSALL